jgi:ATP-dependent DNA ligase
MLWRPRAGPFADLIEPCHPTLVAKPPSGGGWLHEIKHDGFRMFARRDGERVRLITRNGFDWAARYPLVVKPVAALKARLVCVTYKSCQQRTQRQPRTAPWYFQVNPRPQ